MIEFILATLVMHDGQKWIINRDMNDPQCIELANAFVEAARVGNPRKVRVNWSCQSDDGKWLTPKLFSEVDGGMK